MRLIIIIDMLFARGRKEAFNFTNSKYLNLWDEVVSGRGTGCFFGRNSCFFFLFSFPS